MTLLARRYATALLMAARPAGAVDAIDADLQGLHGQVLDKRVRALLGSPDVSTGERTKMIDKLGAGRHKLVQNLLGLLVRRHRLEVLFDLHPAYRSLLMAERGEVEGVVETPRPLDASSLQQVTELARRLSGQRVALDVQVRPELLGGIRLRLGNVLWDGSLKSALDQLERQLLQAPV